MSEIPATKCPHCGGATVYHPAFNDADLDALVTCPGCQGQATKRQFLSSLINKADELFKEAFPGGRINIKL